MANVVTNKGAIVSGIYSFAQTETVPYMFMNTTTAGYTLNGSTGAFAQITDVNFPPNATPARNLAYGAAYLDGYIFVMTTDGRIYNSNSEDPTTWNALNYVTKTSEADGGVALAKHLNYILAWGAWSMEVFYDNANPVASPLSRYDAAKTEVGCAASTSVVQFAQTIGWIGQSREGGKGVFLLDGITPRKISTTSIDSFLNASVLNTGATPQVRAWAVTIAGHTFYVLTLKDLDVTFAYDLVEKEWYQWSTTIQTGTVLTEGHLTSEFFAAAKGSSYTLDGSTGTVYTLTTQTYSDGTNPSSITGVNPISFRVITDNIDGDTNNQKFFHSLEVLGDRSGSIINVRHTDDDFSTWSAYRQVNMLRAKPRLEMCGQSRKRSYEVYSTDNQPIRLHSIEFNVKLGSS